MITLTIDNEQVSVVEGTTILEAASKVNIKIPRLCYMEGLALQGACGICVVEVEGERNISRSCVRPVQEGMVVRTNTPRIRNIRKMLIELLLSNHPTECFTCIRTNTCQIRDLASELGVKQIRFDHKPRNLPRDETSVAIVRDPNKCVLCGRCIRICEEVQTVGALDFANRGENLVVTTGLKRGLGNAECVSCGQCIHVCPVAAITEKSHIEAVWQAIDDPRKHVVVQEAPAVRVALGEELGLAPGMLVTGKMHAALKKLGFDTVFDTNFTADLTIMEEGSELVKRVTSGGVLPLMTSCCPAWIKFVEQFYPDLIPNLSTCKSPQQMFGALSKTYFAEKAGIPPEKIVSVSVMPCTAKKFEAQRPEMCSSGYRDVDYVLTTREIAHMIREAGIDFKNLPDAPPEKLMGIYSGAGTIFGATGGVMEAALRTAYKLITGYDIEEIEIEPVRGMRGIRTATVDVNDLKVNVAVVHGLANARKIAEEIRAGKSPYHMIEVMACPGGCVGGGGQPIGFDLSLRNLRAQSLYQEDKNLPCRRSHQNPSIEKIYQEYLTQPLGEKSHHLLHTSYISRNGTPELKELIEERAAK
ncbi:MAG: iron hydrogenase small subunit [Dehalococcoidales bacterium]|nr:iron hydrogenase small subunit [Dehalococcoidales bacterium]